MLLATRSIRDSLAIVGLAFASIASSGRAAAGDSTAERPFSIDRLQQFVQNYCADCHTGEMAEAGLDLDRYTDLSAVLRDRARFEKVLDYLQAHLMPPEGQPQPNRDEVAALADWLRPEIQKADANAPPDPGRVTMRRLNRSEYNNTIRDLVGIDFQPAQDFPADEVGYGFDNIGDVLALPPALLEKYLASAEQIATRAIIADPLSPPVIRIDPTSLKATRRRSTDGRVFSSNAEAFIELELDDGEYIVRLAATGDQAGDEPVRMALRLDDTEVQVFDVTARRDEPAQQCETRITCEKKSHRIGVAFLNDYWNPDDPDEKNRDRNLILHTVEIEGPVDRPVELPLSHRRLMTCAPPADASDEQFESCVREILTPFATRAFRRPVQPAEIGRLVELATLARNNNETFERAIQLCVQAVLVSPHFLFRVEANSGDGGAGIESLSDFALASRLSYFLWSSMPDDELFAAAQSGQLRDPALLERQVRRMLRDPKTQALVENFAEQWLQLRNLATVSPNPKQFPTFDPEMRVAMRTETEMFFGAILREDRSILEFLDANFTFVNQKLAEHYKLPGIEGPEFRRVSLDGTPRGGLLTQASILTVTSNPTRTSPVKRGKFILDQLLGTPLPPPPPNVPELAEGPAIDQSASLRKRMEQHRANAGCAACHQRLDPLGFTLENFDPVGVYREMEGESPIDASGVLPDGTQIVGAAELRALLMQKADQFRRCFIEKMLIYALGRGTERYDRPAIDKICAAVAADGDRFSRVILGIVLSDPFQQRRYEAANSDQAPLTGG